MMQNKGTFTTGCRYDKDPSGTKTHHKPNVTGQYIQDMLASQKGNVESREVSDIEDQRMMNSIWNSYLIEKR